MSSVSEVIELAAHCLGLAQSGGSSGGQEGGATIPDEEKNYLLRCVNLVAGDLAMHAVPLVKSKTVAVTQGFVMYAMIDKNLTEVVSLATRQGKKVRFTPYSNRLLAEDGIYVVTYKYLPGTLTEEDDLPFPAAVGVKAVVYGVACEYCIISGRNNEAVKWQTLFLKELELLEDKKPQKAGVMPQRKWY